MRTQAKLPKKVKNPKCSIFTRLVHTKAPPETESVHFDFDEMSVPMQNPADTSADGMHELVMALLCRTTIKENRHTLYATRLAKLTWHDILAAVRTSTLASVHGLSLADAGELSHAVAQHCREFQRREVSVRVKRSRSPSPDQPKSKRVFPAAMNGTSTNERSVGDIRAHKRSRQALFGITQAIAFDCKLPLTPEFKREARGKSIALLLECYGDGRDFYADLARIMRLVVDEYTCVLPPDLDPKQRAAYAADTPVGALCGAPDTPAESESECDTDEDES